MKAPSAPIVAGVDGSASALSAVGWAAQECARHKVPLRLVHAYLLPNHGYPAAILTGTDIREAIEQLGRDKLEEAVAAVRATAPDVEVTTEVVCCGATALLIEESKAARLVVVGSQGLGTVTGMLVGSTALALAAHGKSPVIVVRGTAVPDGPVVVGVDGSPTSEAALAFAFDGVAASRSADRVDVLDRLRGGEHVHRLAVHRGLGRGGGRRAQAAGAAAGRVAGEVPGRAGAARFDEALVYNAPCPLAIVRPED